MNLQEIEEQEYNFGRQNDFQNAYSWSRMTRKPDDALAIQEALANNKFVIVTEGTDYCPVTDACMGTRMWLNSSYHSREEAEEALNSLFPDEVLDYDLRIYILPEVPQAQIIVEIQDTNEIPF